MAGHFPLGGKEQKVRIFYASEKGFEPLCALQTAYKA